MLKNSTERYVTSAVWILVFAVIPLIQADHLSIIFRQIRIKIFHISLIKYQCLLRAYNDLIRRTAIWRRMHLLASSAFNLTNS